MKTKAVRSRAERLVHMMKERRSRSGRTAGFTLVELIVVIAILAILAGVGTVAYSGYVKKANQAVDIQLAGDVKYALELGLMNELGYTGGVGVKLTTTGASVQGTDSATDDAKNMVDSAMKAAFGEDWETVLKLKYAGWAGAGATAVTQQYVQSSYLGNEDELLGQVGTLAGALGTTIMGSPEVVGPNFSEFLSKNGLASADANTKANAAVLYVAQKTNAMDDAAKANFINALQNSLADNDIGTTLGTLTEATGSTVGGLAALYAFAEGYCQYEKANGNPAALEAFHGVSFEGVTDTGSAASAVFSAFGAAIANKNDANLDKYFNDASSGTTQAQKDASAYLSVMDAITESSDVLMENLESPECYTDGTVSNLLTGYIIAGSINVGNGEIVVVANRSENGISILAYPVDYSK